MPIDISEYLNLVRTGTGVNDVRGAIANATEELGVYLDESTDIATELQIIESGVYGRDIRQAIHDALYKLSQKEGGGSTFPDPITSDFYSVIDGVSGSIQRLTAMPHMEGITNFYDCKKGLTTSSWTNQAANENNAVLTGATITQDGDLQVLCTSASHGYFDANISHGGSYSMCLYAIYKGDICGFVNQNRHVIGSCYGLLSSYTPGGWLTAAIGGYRGDYDRLGADLWGMGCGSSVYCDSYHVVAVNKLYWQSTYNWYKVSMYIDGVLISETSDFRVPSGIKFGIGALRDANNEFGYNDRDLPIWIKMIAVGGESHSAEQIAQNSAWLRQYYNLS